jgi:signal transduction histidine kinase/DNA-binding LacI/PurR family transcriptional regulator
MRIAFYVNNLDEEYQLAIYRSVSSRAKELGMDVICILQERIGEEFGSLKNFPSHRFIQVDGVLLLSSVLMEQSNILYGEKIKSIFGDVPVISVSTHIVGLPSLIIKTQASMEKLMEHLLNVHHYERFIYIGGPQTHQDNIIRESVFKRAIEEARKTNPSITNTIIHAGFNQYVAMIKTADYIQNHQDEPADVIVSANDTMAIGALNAIQTQHDERWAHCAVTGFDDVPGARVERPALTTINQPTQQMGTLAVEMIYKLITHQKADQLIKVDSSLIIRNSCGCAKKWNSESEEASKELELREYITQIQREQVKTEQIQQHSSYFGQLLNGVDTEYDIITDLRMFLGNIGIQFFYLLLFPEKSNGIPDKAMLYFRKVNGEETVFNPPRIVVLKDFFANELFTCTSNASNIALHYINSGSEQLGMILYEADNTIQPQLCSTAILLGNTINRIRFIQSEKERSIELEKEVKKRTKEIVNANKQLAEESQRRIMVEAEVLKISEQERMRFSMDLHDDICQRLAGISMMCQGMSAMQPDLEELSTLIDETLHRTRQYAHDSFPMELDSLGMNEAIGSLCHTVQEQSNDKTTVNYTWDAKEPLPLDRAQKINVYRIIQEALHNTMKHANATKVDVSIIQTESNLTVTVSDNGKGNSLLNKDPTITDFQTASKHGSLKSVGIGLRSMYYRADQIGAKFTIHSTVNVGTLVRLIIPIN